jgi:hypothetical protein
MMKYSTSILSAIFGCYRQAKRDLCIEIYSMHRSLLYEAGLRELSLDLHTLVRVSLGVIANDGQLEVLPLKGVDQQDNVAY